MIVNTAYPYMKSGEPVNPVVFDGNTVNYTYSTKGTVSLTSTGFRFNTGYGMVQFENVDLAKFTKLNLTGKNASQARESIQIQIKTQDGSVSDIFRNIMSSGTTVNFDIEIPAAFRVKNCVLELSTDSLSGYYVVAMNLTCK